MTFDKNIISEVIKFEGSPDDLVWKFPGENFNTTSQLIVDETHEALLVINGNAADLFSPGRRTLSTANIPLVNKLIEIPTSGESAFPCKIFFINQVHHMDLLWGTHGPITLNDPLYDVFLHVGLCGSMTVSVSNSRKFMLKCTGFRDSFDSESLINNFRGIISSHVKKYISKIMIEGFVSYFVINANLFEIGEVVKEQLDIIFDEYGVKIEYFNIETITVPDSDFAAVSASKERRAGRIIEGYTWQEERQMTISEKYAGNTGALGSVGGAVGGFMMGSAFGGSVSDLARNVLSPDKIPTEIPPKDTSKNPSPMGNNSKLGFNVAEFFEKEDNKMKINPEQSEIEDNKNVLDKCPYCDALVLKDAVFCSKCGKKFENVCPTCKTLLMHDVAFCHKCGTKLN